MLIRETDLNQEIQICENLQDRLIAAIHRIWRGRVQKPAHWRFEEVQDLELTLVFCVSPCQEAERFVLEAEESARGSSSEKREEARVFTLFLLYNIEVASCPRVSLCGQ